MRTRVRAAAKRDQTEAPEIGQSAQPLGRDGFYEEWARGKLSRWTAAKWASDRNP